VSDATVVVHQDAGVLANAAAVRLITQIVDAQATGAAASVVLTGGTIADRMYKALNASPARDAVDWSRVDFWWGDERFLPLGDPDRNETQVRAALLDALPLDPARVHPMPASDGADGDDPDLAAARYVDELLGPAGALPHFDIVLLGMGPDGHVASLFPGHPELNETRPAAAVRNSPKPPPTRLTLSFDVINSADEVWLIASGEEKAKAVGAALSGGTPVDVPAAGVHGTKRTLWLLDRESASAIPAR